MAYLNEKTSLEIVNFLTELLEEDESRKQLIQTVLGSCMVVSQLDFERKPRVFAQHCLRTLMNYHDKCDEREPALSIVLRKFQEILPPEGTPNITEWIHAIYEGLPGRNGSKGGTQAHASSAFVSYAHKNEDIVMNIIEELRRAIPALQIWVDKEQIAPGTPDWRDALKSAIEDSAMILWMASPDSRASEVVIDELTVGKKAELKILPVWIAGDTWLEAAIKHPVEDGDSETNQLDRQNLDFRYTQYVDVRDGNYKIGLQDLIYTLRYDASMLTYDLAEEDNLKNLNILRDAIETNLEETLNIANIDDTTRIPDNPFPGLSAFKEEDHDRFFGREALVTTILNKMETSRLQVIAGPSGSGKSSIAQAGIIPELKAGCLKESQNWIYPGIITPSHQPVSALRTCFANYIDKAGHLDIEDFDTALQKLDSHYNALAELSKQISSTPQVLVIDQFEELFTLSDKANDEKLLIENLVSAIKDEDCPLHIIITMRADFLNDIYAHKSFAELVFDNLTPVPQMDIDDLLNVIEKPVEQINMRYEPKLVATILIDTMVEKIPLPLLQFTLGELFEQRDSDTLTHQAYDDIGGVQKAISNRAEIVFQSLNDEEERVMARALFLRMVEINDNGAITRKTIPYKSLNHIPEMQELARKFVDARLLTTGSYLTDSKTEERGRIQTSPEKADLQAWVTLSHETLIHNWSRFSKWIDEYQADILHYAEISERFRLWQANDEPDPDDLLPDKLLETATGLDTNYMLDGLERDYLQLSLQASRNRRLRRIGVAIASILVIIFIILFLIRDNAQLQAEADYLNAQINWIETRVPGLGGNPLNLSELTQTPRASFLATATAGVQAIQSVATPTIEIDPLSNMEMLYVPAGCFWMGSHNLPSTTRQNEVREVCPDAFWIDRYEVTNAQIVTLTDSYPPGAEIEFTPGQNNENHPVTGISMRQALIHCETRNARLPTEIEWEYVARGPDSRAYTWGNNLFAGNSPFIQDDRNNLTLRVPEGFSVFSVLPAGTITEDVTWMGALDMNTNVREITTIGRDDNITAYVLKGGFNETLNPLAFLLASGQQFDISEQDNVIRSTGFRCVRPVNA